MSFTRNRFGPMKNSTCYFWQAAYTRHQRWTSQGVEGVIHGLVAIWLGVLVLLLCWPSGPAAAQEVRVVGSPPGDAVLVVRFAPRGQPENWQEAQLQGGSYRLVDSGGRVDPGTYFIRVSAPGCEEVTVLRFVDAATRVRIQLECPDERGDADVGEEQDVESESYAAQDPESFTHRVIVRSSREHAIEDANVQLSLRSGPDAEGAAMQQQVRYENEGGGRYVASFDQDAEGVGSNIYELRVEAQDHAPYVRALLGLDSTSNAAVIHNNYYARCNERMPTDTWNFWRTDPWEECSIDPERLIETFGSDHKRFLLPSPGGSREKATFRGRTYVFHPDISAVVHSFSRSLAYDKLIPKIVQAPARAHAIATGRVAMEEIEQQLAANERLSLGALTASTAGTLAEIAEVLESFAGPLSAAGHAFSLTQAHRDGQLEGMVQVAAHTVGMEQAVAQFETLVADSWLREDKLLVDAIEKAKKTIAEEREATIEEIVANYGNAEFNDAAEAIVFGASVKAIFGGALKAAGVGAVVKTAAVFAVHDFLRSVEDRDQERTMLAAAALLDRELLSRYPDRLEDMNPGTMEPDELNGAIMRLALGILFNETRAAHLGGESRTLVGRGFQYAFASEMPSSEREAYDREMIRVSLEKSEQAEEAIIRLAEYLGAGVRAEPDASELQATAQALPKGLLLNKRYRDSGSSRHYTFVRRGNQLVSQFRGGNVVGTYGCGMKNMEQDPADPSRFITKCASGMGMESVAFSFGVAPDGRAYFDVAGGYRDGAERFFADTRRTYTCGADDAVALAADYFAPACSFDSSYAPYDHVALNPHGREAFVMPSCAGPRTRGRITYLLVERRTPCQAIGTISGLYDPAPVFTLSPDEGLSPRRMGGEEVHWAAPYVLTVETSSGTYTYTFDWDAQEYRRSN